MKLCYHKLSFRYSPTFLTPPASNSNVDYYFPVTYSIQGCCTATVSKAKAMDISD